MLIFFDTEFTQFRDGELLSIGLVTEGGNELYLEVLDPHRHGRASDFCRTTVLPQFGAFPGAGVHSDKEAGLRLADWLDASPGELLLCSDYKLDRFYFEGLLVGCGRRAVLGERIRHLDVAELASDERSLAAFDAYFDSTDRAHPMLMRHHALVDALTLRERWRAAEMAPGRLAVRPAPIGNSRA